MDGIAGERRFGCGVLGIIVGLGAKHVALNGEGVAGAEQPVAAEAGAAGVPVVVAVGGMWARQIASARMLEINTVAAAGAGRAAVARVDPRVLPGTAAGADQASRCIGGGVSDDVDDAVDRIGAPH